MSRISASQFLANKHQRYTVGLLSEMDLAVISNEEKEMILLFADVDATALCEQLADIIRRFTNPIHFVTQYRILRKDLEAIRLNPPTVPEFSLEANSVAHRTHVEQIERFHEDLGYWYVASWGKLGDVAVCGFQRETVRRYMDAQQGMSGCGTTIALSILTIACAICCMAILFS